MYVAIYTAIHLIHHKRLRLMGKHKEVVNDDGVVVSLGETAISVPLRTVCIVVAEDNVYPSIKLTHQLCDIFLAAKSEVAKVVDFIFLTNY
jgi:hypothetical protein